MKKLHGITIAMVTPITAAGEVDYAALSDLTNMLVAKGVDCLYPCGTTGEMLRLSVEERKKVAQTIVEAAAGRVTIFVHCGAMNQADTIALVQHAKACGADGAGVVTPVFFGQNNRELEEYFVAVCNAAPDFPVYLYNIPQCAANDLPVQVAENVVKRCSNAVGLKYSFADINRTIDYLKIGDANFSVLHGCDRALLAFLTLGCDGTISGTACVFPEPFVAAYKAYKEGNLEKAQKLQKICVKFCDALKCGSNMSYFKEGLKMRGINAGFMRKPQLDIEAGEIARLKTELEALCKEANITLEL